MYLEFVLVEKGIGIFYYWFYESDVVCDVVMEILFLLEFSYFLLVKLYLLGEVLGLDSEKVCFLVVLNVRCLLVILSGTICIFYDKFFRGVCLVNVIYNV